MSDDRQAIRPFAYRTPETTRPKTHVMLGRTDRLLAAVQAVTKGGETNLHSHSHLDGLWFVLRGRARFYSGERDVVGEFGTFEGVLVPRGAKYWFESAGKEPLEILQVECSDVAFASEEELAKDRTDYTTRTRAPGARSQASVRDPG